MCLRRGLGYILVPNPTTSKDCTGFQSSVASHHTRIDAHVSGWTESSQGSRNDMQREGIHSFLNAISTHVKSLKDSIREMMDVFHTRLPDRAPKFRAFSSPVLQSCIAVPRSQPRISGRLTWVTRHTSCPSPPLGQGQLSGELCAPGEMPHLLLWLWHKQVLCRWQALVFSFNPAP